MRPERGRCQLQPGTYHDEGQAEGPDLWGRARSELVVYIVDIGVAQYYTSEEHTEDRRKMQAGNVSEAPAERVGKKDEDEEAEDATTG